MNKETREILRSVRNNFMRKYIDAESESEEKYNKETYRQIAEAKSRFEAKFSPGSEASGLLPIALAKVFLIMDVEDFSWEYRSLKGFIRESCGLYKVSFVSVQRTKHRLGNAALFLENPRSYDLINTLKFNIIGCEKAKKLLESINLEEVPHIWHHDSYRRYVAHPPEIENAIDYRGPKDAMLKNEVFGGRDACVIDSYGFVKYEQRGFIVHV